MSILGDSDDEWGGDQALELPIIGEAGDEALPIVGELTQGNAKEHPLLALPPVGEASKHNILESSFHRLEASPTCPGTHSAPVSPQVEERNASLNGMDLDVVGGDRAMHSDSCTDSGMEGGQRFSTCVADAMFQNPDDASPGELRLPVVGETSGDFAPLPGPSRSSHAWDVEDPNVLSSEMELSKSLLDSKHFVIASVQNWITWRASYSDTIAVHD